MKLEIKNSTTYHSEFKVSKSPGENHVLRLRLGLCVQKVPGTPNTFKDFDGNTFSIREWTTTEWFGFWHTILDQCEMWNNQFWLIPPRTYSELDIAAGDIKFRPNVKCELFVQLWSNPGEAQKLIKVAKLADSVTGDSTRFRSDAVTYDSLDGVAHTFQIPDAGGTNHSIIHYTIPHEIGHALGLGHATPLDESLDLMGYGWSVPDPDLTPILSDCDLEGIAAVFEWALKGETPHPATITSVTCR